MNKTERLFDKNSKTKEFDACVLSCEKRDDGYYAVILDRTAFFPNEGGQVCDHGEIGEANVISVDEKDGVITHTLDRAVEPAEYLHCKLDFSERFRKMQNHTAEHIISGIIHLIFGFDNVGFHLGDGYMTADFNGEMSDEELESVETRANAAIFSCKNIRTYYPSSEELECLEYRSKLDLHENVRIVEIEDIDKCACCAPHVENTGEVGLVKIIDSIRYKGGMRLTMIAGFDALADYRSRSSQIKRISMAISSKQSEVADGVCRLVEENGRLRGKIGALNRAVMQKKLDEIEHTEGSIILFEESDDMLLLRNFVNEGVKKCGGIFAVFVHDGDIYRYIIASVTVDLRTKVREINKALCGRGGGSGTMIQGSCHATSEEIRKYFQSIQ